MDFHDYGIPCKPLPTMDAQWVGANYDAPPAIDGTVLISAGDLSGFEFGPPSLNPYELFKQVKPTTVIDYSVFVYEGHFEIPKAAARSHTLKARDLLKAKQLPEALAESQQAVDARSTIRTREYRIRGCVYCHAAPAGSSRAYMKAPALAQTIAPEFQTGSVAHLQEKLATK